MRRFIFKLAVIGFLLGVQANIAWASVISLNPVRIHLSESKRSEVLVLRNSGTAKARFQFKAYTWNETSDGQMELVPTEDILFFPSLLEIKPGETRRIRMASTLPPGRKERSYRLIASELAHGSGSTVVQVLTKLNIPVFVQATKSSDKPVLTVHMDGGELLVAVQNAGDSYFKAESVRVVARSKSGTPVFQKTQVGWYVLAHGRRDYRFQTLSEQCAELASISATVTTEHGTASASVEVVPGQRCAP